MATRGRPAITYTAYVYEITVSKDTPQYKKGETITIRSSVKDAMLYGPNGESARYVKKVNLPLNK